MGLFCVNLHFRTTDDTALSAALRRQGITQFRVLPAKFGWTTLYEERASQQDERQIRYLGSTLSQDLKVAAIAFLVHDSDIACYWLFDKGQLLDEYNSCPDYFDENPPGDPPGHSGGKPNVLLRYCRRGVRRADLAALLGEDAVFAEGVIQGLAEALGIDPERALADYRDGADDGPGGGGGFDDGDDDDDGDDSGPAILPMRGGRANQLVQMLETDRHRASADPQVLALVQAAAQDDVDAIDRLLATGVGIDVEAPAPIPGEQPGAGLGLVFPGGVPMISMSPLLAAVLNLHYRAAERLLARGADPNRVHPLFGTPLHAATGGGDAIILSLLIDHGGAVNACNRQGQTPLQVIAAGRATRERLAQAQRMMRSMGMKLPGLVDQLSNVTLPLEGWDACELLLKAHGAR